MRVKKGVKQKMNQQYCYGVIQQVTVIKLE